MKYLSITPRTVRRVIAVAATAAAGLAITSAAFAATSASSGTARVAAASAAIPQCAAGLGESGNVAVWVAASQGSTAAGTTYYPLEFTNLSGHTCSLYGFPGVSVITRNGTQLGSPASWNTGVLHQVVNLAPGATAHASLAYHETAVSTEPGCDPVYTAFELRVYPPDQYSATYAFFDLEACSHAGPIYLTVGPIQPGVGTIGNV
jgi:Protein of unknown function (DUF4232)